MIKLSIIFFSCILFVNNLSLFNQYQNFKQYQISYNKIYHSHSIEFYRFGVFLNNLVQISKLNRQEEGTAVYGLTMFTDMTAAQMNQYTGLKIPKNFSLSYTQNFTNDPSYIPKQSTPDIWNWQQQGAVTRVKNQGDCGSCWTFSTVGNIQSLWWIKYHQLIDFSYQQLVDCDQSNFGCNGGWPYAAIDWLAHHGGLQTLTDYPMRSNYSGPCQFSQSKSKVKIAGYLNVTKDQNIIKDAVYQKGPLSVLLDFTGLFHYKSGIANPTFCSQYPDHALVLVGYGIQYGDYWLIKNSWGPSWGINGYLMLKRGAKKCGISQWATTAILDTL